MEGNSSLELLQPQIEIILFPLFPSSSRDQIQLLNHTSSQHFNYISFHCLTQADQPGYKSESWIIILWFWFYLISTWGWKYWGKCHLYLRLSHMAKISCMGYLFFKPFRLLIYHWHCRNVIDSANLLTEWDCQNRKAGSQKVFCW